MKPLRVSLFLVLLALAGACARREEAPTERGAEGSTAARADEAGDAPEPRADAPAPGEAAAEPPTEAEPTADAPAPAAGAPSPPSRERLQGAAQRALAEASRVAPGQNDCETAHARLAALVASMAREAPGSVGTMPPADRFLAVCSSLPPAMQRCLVVEHAIEHEAECAREHAALPADLRASLDGLMAGGG